MYKFCLPAPVIYKVKHAYRSRGAVLVLNDHLDVLELANVTVTASRHLHCVLDTSGAL